MLKIGKLKLKSKLILAPMAGVSDLPYRLLNRNFGSELAFIEMINARSVSYKSKKTQQMLSSSLQDRPLGVQILGSEPKFILKALDVFKKYKFDILDFNAACPAKKVVRRGEGASLLKEPKKLSQLLRLIVKESQVPVTVKIRTGWDKDCVNACEVARYAQDAGVNGLFIHGRTRIQEYSGSVDYQIIRKVKKSISIPVIASGDAFSPQLVKKIFDETGCDAVAIARGALGNPWIFNETELFLKNQKLIHSPSIDEIIRVMKGHLQANIDFYGERVGVMKFRKFFAWYTKGMRKIRPLRECSSRARTWFEMQGIIDNIIV
jgi:tRNA-dihydrouridine synthase B